MILTANEMKNLAMNLRDTDLIEVLLTDDQQERVMKDLLAQAEYEEDE